MALHGLFISDIDKANCDRDTNRIHLVLPYLPANTINQMTNPFFNKQELQANEYFF